jgi:hypothetical protein
MERHKQWNLKRAHGSNTRMLLLVYGFLRGMEYRQIENKSNPDNLMYLVSGLIKGIYNYEGDWEKVPTWLGIEKKCSWMIDSFRREIERTQIKIEVVNHV